LDLVGHEVGAYRILSLLGRGGTAEVYKAFHPALKREVALKVLLQEVSTDHDWVRRFRQEAELLGRLDHPHILPIYDAGEHDGRPFLVMKYIVDTTTLRSQLQGNPWPLNRVVKVVTQVADALDAAHKAGVVHRDIKPSNILVTPDLRCSVFDFGIAKPCRRGDTTTGSDLIVGTPEFMSPEQCKGDRIDQRSDVYSLGVVTYQMLTGHVPFSAETAVGILMKHLTEPLPIPPAGVALPPAVNGVLRKAMARDPNERFSSAGEFAQSLERSADQRATVTIHASGIRRAIPRLKALALPGTRKLRLSTSALVVAGSLGLVFVLWPASSATPPETEGLILPPSAPLADVIAGQDSSAPEEVPVPETAPSTKTTNLATLEIESAEEVQVFLDGKLLGKAPGAFPSLTPGEHIVVLEAGPGRREEKELVFMAGSTHRIRFEASLPRSGPPSHWTASTSPPIRERAVTVANVPEIARFTGFLSDDKCGAKGGSQGLLHLKCAEQCIRDGRQPLLYSRGRLYRLDGFERIEMVRDGPLRFRGWLEGNTIHVVAPPPAGSPSSTSSLR
jgi:serine/threonine protein kinase